MNSRPISRLRIARFTSLLNHTLHVVAFTTHHTIWEFPYRPSTPKQHHTHHIHDHNQHHTEHKLTLRIAHRPHLPQPDLPHPNHNQRFQPTQKQHNTQSHRCAPKPTRHKPIQTRLPITHNPDPSSASDIKTNATNTRIHTASVLISSNPVKRPNRSHPNKRTTRVQSAWTFGTHHRTNPRTSLHGTSHGTQHHRTQLPSLHGKISEIRFTTDRAFDSSFVMNTTHKHTEPLPMTATLTPSPISGRPANGSELSPDGYPSPYLIFSTQGRYTAYCWEIEYAGIGVTGNTQSECLATWLEEYQDENHKPYTPAARTLF